MGSTQDARNAYREHIAGFTTSGKNYAKPYLKAGWVWPRVRYFAGGQISRPYIDLRVHPAAVAYHQALAAIFLFHGYSFDETAGGTVNMRNIGGSAQWKLDKQVRLQHPYATSLHAHGLAIDINPSKNPFGSSRPDEFDQARWARLVSDFKAIHTVDDILATKWGGDWSIDDDMHIEPTLCTRAQLSRGIDFSAIPGWDSYRIWAPQPTRPPPPPEEDGMSIKRGDPPSKGCAEIQKALRIFYGQNNGTWPPWDGVSQYDGQPFAVGEDGDPGATFETNVRNAQKRLGIAESGVADGFTCAYLLAGYGSGDEMDAGDVAAKIAAHAAEPTAHAHRHAEGRTGLPLKP